MPHFPDFTKIDLPPSQGMRVHFGALPATPENAEQIAIPALAVGHAKAIHFKKSKSKRPFSFALPTVFQVFAAACRFVKIILSPLQIL